ncbi:hypothetical protein CERZMDRAFT_89620 [Cercospora zeae-maydis SCOH1-5]|uniref:Uncharacterized protein n=1 Tax=Cercospora zeae-maydis SCOH1-5 TaxID=717836 RepID=A0A6A6FWM9_9PEZI|nr:hypothetical protein CERZMDRAFT_89620 [Cercospora zeae-maydis SCOH1-5]
MTRSLQHQSCRTTRAATSTLPTLSAIDARSRTLRLFTKDFEGTGVGVKACLKGATGNGMSYEFIHGMRDDGFYGRYPFGMFLHHSPKRSPLQRSTS